MNRLPAMEAFVRVVDTGSFSGAARQLRIGQPAVSKAVSQLEARLGVRLLLRSTHRLTPTEAGENFYVHAKRSIEAADEADRAARGAGAGLAGRLRFCAAVTFARLHIVPVLGQFLTEHPAVDVEAVLDDGHVDLIEAGIDVALRMGDLADSALPARKIAQGRRLVVATPEYFEGAGMPTAPVDLMRHQAIIYDRRGGGSAWTFRRADEEAPVMLNGRVRMTAAEGVRGAVLGHLGLTVSSDWMFAPELANGTVVSVLDEWTLPAIDLWAVFPTGSQANAKARAFVGFVQTKLAGRVRMSEGDEPDSPASK